MTIDPMQGDDRYDLCLCRPASECEGCSLDTSLKCRFDRADLLHFLGMFVGFALPAVVGVLQTGYGWYLLGWAGFCLIFFELWEIRILCSHCPYYAKEGRTLRCIANYGSLKVWRYRPEPINRSETLQLMLGFVILGGYPFPFMILGGQYLWGLVALWGLGMFFWTLRKYVCSECVNFSCFLNRVPRQVVDAYLRRNPTMRRAWEKSGWYLEE